MNITEILSSDKLSAEEKLSRVVDIVDSARDSYGNLDVDIPVTKINTTHGNLPFTHLENVSKVEILINEALNMKSTAIAVAEDNPGIVLNRKVQELLAINPFFANISTKSEFEYL